MQSLYIFRDASTALSTSVRAILGSGLRLALRCLRLLLLLLLLRRALIHDIVTIEITPWQLSRGPRPRGSSSLCSRRRRSLPARRRSSTILIVALRRSGALRLQARQSLGS